MRIKFTTIADGPGPSEEVIGIRTADGSQEEVVLSKRLLSGRGVDIGMPLLHEDDKLLIELPRESASGRWRIWIPQTEVIDSPAMQAAE
ncbi:hypothetical protein [Aureimonas glaciei]|uniref:Uncharacterized protein n=1 Tax=Aureimonas glaciei TaxID=1776957 RepID=A0A916XX43_9HYPH|nr:hypothetical protein [Aureimonas glaciei]GGD18666.1 hypothetical protein GCM10011335_21970 [Aureimonas glaciei]